MNWNIVHFYQKSFALLKDNPKLLLLGIAMLVLSAGYGSINYNPTKPISNTSQETEDKQTDSFSISELRKIFDESKPKTELQTFEPGSENEKSETSFLIPLPSQSISFFEKEISRLIVIITAVSKKVPPWTYYFLTIQSLVLFVGSIVFSLAISAWIQAAMIAGIAQADSDSSHQWRLGTVTKIAISKIRPMIWLNIIPLYKLIIWLMLTIIALLLAVGMGIVINDISEGIMATLSFIVLILIIIIFSLKKMLGLVFAQILGRRLVVFKALSGKEAFNQAKKLVGSSKQLMRLVLLSCSHYLSFSIIAPLLGITPFVVVLVLFFRQISQNLVNLTNTNIPELLQTIISGFTFTWGVVFIVAGGLTLFLLIASSVIARVVINSNWHWAYLSLTKNYSPILEKEESEAPLQ
jgi:hypothetical protein